MWWARLLNNLISLYTGAALATSYESIATVTVGAGGASSVDFTSIPSTYKHLQIRMIARGNYAGSDDDIKATFNSDTSNAANHGLYGTGSSAAAYAATTGLPNIGRFAGAGSSANVFGVSVADILDYTNTNKYKTVRSLCGVDNNGAGIVLLESSLWLNTSAITSINLKPVSGTAFNQYSSFALYGVKG